jgi:ferredoxin-NADP reductase
MATPTAPVGTVVTELETDVTVRSVRHPADDVVELTLAAPDGRPLPPWTPGAHVDLLLGSDLIRQYSLCSSPSESSEYRVAVLRTPDSRGGSVAVHALTADTTIRIRGPRNNFPLLSSERYVFIAGGIGITPLLPMIEEAVAGGADWHLWYGGRTRASMAYLPELEAFGDRVTVVPQDEQGMLDLGAILYPGLLLRPRAVARGRGGAVRRLAPRLAPPGALRRQGGRP